MNTINDIKLNCNSNNTKLIDLFNKSYIRNSLNKNAENNNKIDTYLSFIPTDLLTDVEWVVNNTYNGDYLNYFESVALYFSTFSYEDLTIANTFQGDLYNSPDCNTRLKRHLKRQRKPKIFHASVLLKLVGKGGKFYFPNSLFNEFKLDKTKEQNFIRSNVIVGTDGKIVPLSLATKTVEQNIAEKLNILDTMERIAEKKGWTWCFITLTLEGEFHPNPTKGKNSYNGVSPRDSAKLLNEKIKNARALLAKRGLKAGISYHGCSSAEAHKDGCLHKHLLVFVAEKDLQLLKDTFFYTFENLNEESFRINDGRAKASSYVFKYVMKSISAFDNNLDIMKVTEKDKELYGTMLNGAFRSYNFIRGFSFFGIENCLTKFRFLARNLKKLNLPLVFEQLVREQNLYELLTNGYFDEVENIYIKDGEHKKFVGCKVNNVQFLKNFFKMCKKEAGEKSNEVFSEMAKLVENNILELLGVIVNPNYSRKDKNKSFLTELNKKLQNFENIFFDWWIKENPINRELEFYEIVDTSDCPF